MKNKLLGVSICLMMLATILPITVLASCNTSYKNSGGPIDYTTVRGIVVFRRTSDGGKNIHFFAIRVHYSTVWLSGEHENGLVKMEPIIVPSDLNGIYGNFYIFASFRGSLSH
jgi:hypothetical protein